MSLKPKRTCILALVIFVAIMASASLPVTSAVGPAGQWRLLSPTEYTANPASNMHGIFLINGGTSGKGSGNGWAVSDNGFIFFWDGFSWNQANSPTGCQLDSVNFGGPLNPLSNGVQTSSGWIVGGAVNPGASATCVAAGNAVSLYWNGIGWTSYSVPKTGGTAEMLSVSQVQSASSSTDSVNAFAVGVDGGNGAFWQWSGVPGLTTSWTEVTPTTIVPGTTGNPVNSVYMTHCSGSSPCTGDDGIAVGNGGHVWRFQGGTWNLVTSAASVNLYGVAMSSQTSGWAVGASCEIFRTTDGNTWSGPTTPSGCTATLRSIVLLSSSEGWAVGDADAQGHPTIVHGVSLDSSPSWTPIPVNQVTPTGTPSGVGLNAVTFATSGGNVWAVGAGGVAAFCQNNCSSASGSIWSTTTSPLTGSASVLLSSVFMDSDSDGWAVGTNALGAQALIQWNGYSWTQAPFVSPITTAPLFGVYMQGSSNAWAVGGTGTVASTLYFDGNTWTGKMVPACTCSLNSVFMISGSESWAVGTGGIIMHSTTQGGSFQTSPTSYPNPPFTSPPTLNTVFFDSSQSGWAGGDISGAPIIIHTTNDGADAWAVAFTNPGGVTAGTVTSLFFQDSTHGWATLGTGATSTTILYWNGVSWTKVSPITSHLDKLNGIFVEGGTPATDGWAVGVDTVTNSPVTIQYDGTTWAEMSLTPAITGNYSPSGLTALYLRSSTNGLAVGGLVSGNPSTLALILHLDPPGATGGGGASTTASTASTSVVTSTEASGSSSIVTTSSQSSTAESASTTTETSISTTVSTSMVSATSVITQTVTTSSSATTPLALPGIPGFPWESIITGIILGIAMLGLLRQARRKIS